MGLVGGEGVRERLPILRMCNPFVVCMYECTHVYIYIHIHLETCNYVYVRIWWHYEGPRVSTRPPRLTGTTVVSNGREGEGRGKREEGRGKREVGRGGEGAGGVVRPGPLTLPREPRTHIQSRRSDLHAQVRSTPSHSVTHTHTLPSHPITHPPEPMLGSHHSTTYVRLLSLSLLPLP